MRGMHADDIEALRDMMEFADPCYPHLVDIAKFPFFGADNNHPMTASFTTFALRLWLQTLIKQIPYWQQH